MRKYKRVTFDKDHCLCIEKNKLQKVYCPHQRSESQRFYCGSWCAVIGEPEKVLLFEGPDDLSGREFTKIEMCSGEIITRNFKDERNV